MPVNQIGSSDIYFVFRNSSNKFTAVWPETIQGISNSVGYVAEWFTSNVSDNESAVQLTVLVQLEISMDNDWYK